MLNTHSYFTLAISTPDTAAQNTLAKAMVEWWMATDREDALKQIAVANGADLAGIENSVISGLAKAAEILGVSLEDLVSERDLTPLAHLNASQIVVILDAIHLQWIEDNFTAKRWAEKHFKGVLGQYRKTSKISYEEVIKDFLFIQEYLIAAGSTVTLEEIKDAFAVYAVNNASDDDLPIIADRARALADDIIPSILAFREKMVGKKPAMVETIDAFLVDHNNPAEIIEIMLSCIN